MHDSHFIYVCHSARPSLTASTVKSSSEVKFNAEILSMKQSKLLMHSIKKGQQVTYKVQRHKNFFPSLPPDRVLHPDVQRVMNKHSAKRGTLCGEIP
jgi:hypothetical protein